MFHGEFLYFSQTSYPSRIAHEHFATDANAMHRHAAEDQAVDGYSMFAIGNGSDTSGWIYFGKIYTIEDLDDKEIAGLGESQRNHLLADVGRYEEARRFASEKYAKDGYSRDAVLRNLPKLEVKFVVQTRNGWAALYRGDTVCDFTAGCEIHVNADNRLEERNTVSAQHPPAAALNRMQSKLTL